MVWDPTPSDEVEQVALLVPSSAWFEQSVVVPSLNVTVSCPAVGLPPVALTVAVKVTLVPKVLGLGLLVTVVVVARCVCTVTKTGAEGPEVLPAASVAFA